MAQYIERAKVTDALIDETSIVGIDLEEAVNAVCGIPAADVRPVTRAKWIRNERGNYNCSNCKSEYNAVFGFSFCPNCGADMRSNDG